MSRLNAMADRLAGAPFGLTNYNNCEADVNYMIGVATVASATTLAITTRTTMVTGTVTIANISDALGAVGGQPVLLIFAAALTMQNNGGGSGNIRTRSGVDRAVAAGEVVTLYYDASALVWREGPRVPGDQLDYAQITADVTAITATTEGTAVSVIAGNSITYDGSKVKVEAWTPGYKSAATQNRIFFVVLCDSTVVGQAIVLSNGTGENEPVKIEAFHTPTAAAHTYALKAFVENASFAGTVRAGAGGSGAVLPAFLRITKA